MLLLASRNKNGEAIFQLFHEKTEMKFMEMDFCKTEMKVELFLWKRKQKWNNIFWRNRRGNGIFFFI
jgi:hypothetical protein